MRLWVRGLAYFKERKHCPESYDEEKEICPQHPVEKCFMGVRFKEFICRG